jgi:hypothetical protein
MSVLRIAAIVLLVAFFLPWGSVWVFSGCASRTDETTLGTASGWDMTIGQDYQLPQGADRTPRSVSLEPQQVGFIIPIFAVGVLALSLAAVSRYVANDVVYWFALLGSVPVGIVVVYLAGNVSIPSSQKGWLRPMVSDETGEINISLGFEWGIVALLLFILLTTIGTSGMFGLTMGSDERYQRHLERRAARNKHDGSQHVRGAPP